MGTDVQRIQMREKKKDYKHKYVYSNLQYQQNSKHQNRISKNKHWTIYSKLTQMPWLSEIWTSPRLVYTPSCIRCGENDMNIDYKKEPKYTNCQENHCKLN